MTEWKNADESWKDEQGRTVSYEPPVRRKCELCRHMFDWDGAEYKKCCLNCFKAKARPCATCPATIPPTSEPWVKSCVSCYINSKRSRGFQTCPTCPPERRTHLVRPPDKAACQMCEKYLRVCVPNVPVAEEPQQNGATAAND